MWRALQRAVVGFSPRLARAMLMLIKSTVHRALDQDVANPVMRRQDYDIGRRGTAVYATATQATPVLLFPYGQ